MDEKLQLVHNLIALGFDIKSKEVKYGCQFDEHMFDKPNKRAFEVVVHFLFHQLDHKNAAKMFRTCFPGTNKKYAQEFRKVTFNWLKKISEDNANFGLPKVSSTLLMCPGGSEFVRLIFMFSVFVLHKKTTSLQTEGVLYPPLLTKHKRLKAQMKTVLALSQSDFKEFQRQLQLNEMAEENLQEFADQQINIYHALLRKKKQLVHETNVLLGPTATTFSDMKQTEFKKQRSRNLGAKIERARSMWNTVLTCVNETAPHVRYDSDFIDWLCSHVQFREVIGSVVNDEGLEKKIDGNKLRPTIPAKLLDTCQEEIYQTVGTSLYENGNINLSSLVALENLALELLADKIHQEGFPNFDRQNAWLKTRFQLHREEASKLEALLNNLVKENSNKQSSIRETEEQLDAIYNSMNTRHDQTLQAHFDVADASPAYGKHQLSATNANLSKCEDFTPCKEGIAPKYFLPSDKQNEFLENLFMDEIENPAALNEVDYVNATSPQRQRFDAWEIPAPELSSPYRNSPKHVMSAKKHHPMHSLIKTGGHLKQGKTKRLDSSLKARFKHDWSDDLATRFKETLSVPLHQSSKKKRGRLSISLPSSPLMTYRSDDVVVQKVTSRTPEAERKLVDQIVRCTCDGDNDSPLIVYETEGKSQLDRTAFLPRDKITRTPLKVNVLPHGDDPSFSREVHSNLSDSSEDECFSSPFPAFGFSKVSSRQVVESEKDVFSSDAQATESTSLSPCSSSVSVTFNRNVRSADVSKAYLSPLFTAANGASSTVTTSTSIDTLLDSLIDENPAGIMDLSTPLFSESFEDDTKKFDIPTTDALVALDVPDSNFSQASPLPAEKSGSRAVEMLMSTPPLPLEDQDSRKENEAPHLMSSCSKNPPMATPERPMLHQFQLNLLPVPDFQTPELQHFKSVLERK